MSKIQADKQIEAFGEVHTLKEWAKLLSVRLGALDYLLSSGKSIEDVAEFMDITYPPPRERKPREGRQMALTRDLVENLLVRSGYEVEPDLVSVSLAYNTTHNVRYKGRVLGQYDYNLDRLTGGLNGATLRLRNPYRTDYTIKIRVPAGWEFTAETRARMNLKRVESAPSEADLANIFNIEQQRTSGQRRRPAPKIKSKTNDPE